MQNDNDNRDRALNLLRENHVFPGPFEFRAVVRPDRRDAVIEALVTAAGGQDAVVGVTERPSRNATYLSVRVEMHIDRAEQVLELYDVLKAVDGVIMAL